MSSGANEVHKQLRESLENYIKSQYFGKSPILLSAIRGKLDQEGVLYKKPYIESSPAYKTILHGIQLSKTLPNWLKDYFEKLSEANLGVYPAPFAHQVKALEAAISGRDLFVSTGTGSGKTECFMWPLLAKLAAEAREKPKCWDKRGVRTIIMYPMNALVSDQLGRLRRLIGDPEHRFINIFRDTCGGHSRRPQFGMYTGRTPYPGIEPKRSADKELAETYYKMTNTDNEKEKEFLQKLIKDGKLPAKESYAAFIDNLNAGKHRPSPEDAELVTRFEMQQVCPDILITNYSMLEYMLFRPHEAKIWNDTKAWLKSSPDNKLLFVIDEAHMYRGASGGEVSLLLRRLLHRLDIKRDRVQFILTTASMPNKDEEDRKAVKEFANALTISDVENDFCYLEGEKEVFTGNKNIDIPVQSFLETKPESFEREEDLRLEKLNEFWKRNTNVSFDNLDNAYQWMYDHLMDFYAFNQLFSLCRGNAVSLDELAESIFPKAVKEDAIHAVEVMLAIAPLARNKEENVLFPARMHMLFRGIQGVFACTNPNCPHGYKKNGLSLGEIYFSDDKMTCKECGSVVCEVYNDRHCGSIFFKGYVLSGDFTKRQATYLWHQPGTFKKDEIKEIHLYIPEDDYRLPEKQGEYKIQPCYLDIASGFVYFNDDSLDGKSGIRKLYYCDFSAKGRPNVITFSTCPHCHHELSRSQLTSFGTKGNFSFFNLVKAQFLLQPPVSGKMGDLNKLPNEGRKVLLFSDSRQRAAKLARDMSSASDIEAARQLTILAIQRMEGEKDEDSTFSVPMNELYDYFAMYAAEKHVHIFPEKEYQQLVENGEIAYKNYGRSKKRNRKYKARYSISEHAPDLGKELLLKLYCGAYNTLVDSALSWIEPSEEAMDSVFDEFDDHDIDMSEEAFLELFNAWMLGVCDNLVILGQTIPSSIRMKVRPNYSGYGLPRDWHFNTVLLDLMGIKKNSTEEATWVKIFRDCFMAEAPNSGGQYYIDLNRVSARFDLNHQWYKCEECSEITPFTFKGHCPICKSEHIHPMQSEEYVALDFWRRPILDAIEGKDIRVIDTEEHTAQLSYKDQRDDLWSKTEKYELRFQDFLQEGESPVDILSSTTTMEVGIDIGSLVAVGLRNVPPMRENYQQRAGRAGRRGSSLSTIVTFCEDGPHDSLYFNNPVPMFRGDPRRPWVDVNSNKIVQRHLSMEALQEYLNVQNTSLDDINAIDFLDEHLNLFEKYLQKFNIDKEDILVPVKARNVLAYYKDTLMEELRKLKAKRDAHPELFDIDENKQKKLLDALYDEGIIPTYSFPKSVVSTYIQDGRGKLKYQVDRGIDMAIGEYAPGRSIVVDKTTYQIGGLYYPGMSKDPKKATTPARSFIQDPNYVKEVVYCSMCGWFGLKEDNITACPFCGNPQLGSMRSMLRPWGFGPRDGRSIEVAQLTEEYSPTQQPLYSTLPESDDVTEIKGCKNMRMAIRPNQRIIVLNKGIGDKGFMVCCDCGAAMPGDDVAVLKGVKRPYTPKTSLPICKHSNTKNVNLGYDFITDMWVLEVKLDKKYIAINTDKESWLNRAGQSLAEALHLAICHELDIEFTEIVSGYRIRKNQKGNFVDIYLYDSLSSGAGYAVSIGHMVNSLLQKTRQILEQCTCECACDKCLKHYRNQYVHSLLDRKAALNLLDWAESGILPKELTISEQKVLLEPLRKILERMDVKIAFNSEAILAENSSMIKKIVVYPALLNKPSGVDTIFLNDCELKYAKPLALKTITAHFNFLK